jgi:methionyl-tRNA formyltransferase
MGTPQFAVPTLQRIVADGHDVARVYTQPDRPKGRGHKLAPPPIKEAAIELGLALSQPERIRRPELLAELSDLQADVMVVVGYGQIIPQTIIDLPALGIVNVHASLLPKYRGAAPIQWAIANGETVTGVTTMQINAGLDTGDMLLKRETAIRPGETAAELSERLARLGAELLSETLEGLSAGSIQPQPQNEDDATFAPILKKTDGLIDWEWPARKVADRVRGFSPWPGCYTTWRGQKLHIWRADAHDIGVGSPGSIHPAGRDLIVACGASTSLQIREVQLEGRKRMATAELLNGRPLITEEMLGDNKN